MNRPTLAASEPCLQRLVLELRHAGGLAETRDAVQDPGKLGVLGHLGLDEQGALVHVDAAGDVLRGGDAGARASSGGSCVTVMACRSGMKKMASYSSCIRTQLTSAPR